MTSPATETAAGECGSCDDGLGGVPDECPKSKRQCGHHCNHVWTHDACDWCGAEVDDEGQVVIPSTEPDALGPCFNCGFMLRQNGPTIVHDEGLQEGKGTCALNPYGKFMATVREDYEHPLTSGEQTDA